LLPEKNMGFSGCCSLEKAWLSRLLLPIKKYGLTACCSL
jgi:hypothetical protein